MIELIKDLCTLIKLKLPPSFDKKHVIVNFLIFYTLSFPSCLKPITNNTALTDQNAKIKSDVWKSFNHIISMYVKYISTKFLTKTYVIRGVATGWHSKSYINFLKENFTQEHKSIIPSETINIIDRTSRALTNHFDDMDYDAVNRWLLTYQYGLNKFYKNQTELADKLQNIRVIELGAGIGANIAVHAALSKTGVAIYDIPPMLEIQKRILGEIGKDVDMSEIQYFSDPDKLIEHAKKQPYILISYWAFTEFPLELRKKLEPLIQDSELSFFTCNSIFEEIDNLEYFSELKNRLNNKTITNALIDWNPYKKHSYVMIK